MPFLLGIRRPVADFLAGSRKLFFWDGIMSGKNPRWQRFVGAGGLVSLLGIGLMLVSPGQQSKAGPLGRFGRHRMGCAGMACEPQACPEFEGNGFGAWYWLHSPDQEQRFTASIFNRYCLRCHAADGS